MQELAAWIRPFEINKPAEIFCLCILKQKLWWIFYLSQLFTQKPFNDNGNSNLVKDWSEHFRKDCLLRWVGMVGASKPTERKPFLERSARYLAANQAAIIFTQYSIFTQQAVPALSVGTSQRLLEAACRHQLAFLSYAHNWALVTFSSHVQAFFITMDIRCIYLSFSI